MDNLIGWLREQLDEDERLIADYEAFMVERANQAGTWAFVPTPGWEPGEPFDPTRVLAEVEAKRAILDLHAGDGGHECVGQGDAWGSATIYATDCPTIRLLAQPYAGRPGYRPEWSIKTSA